MPVLAVHRVILASIISLTAAATPARAADDRVLVFAAASLTNALNAVAEAWMAETGNSAIVSFAGSSQLARQIQAGAPADIFFSANAEWMDAVETSGDLRDGTRTDVLGNRLVLVAHGANADPVVIDETLDLAGMLGDERLAIALVNAVPAGIYGREALTALGLWDDVAPLVAQSDNVRAALAFVAQGEAPLGIVFATDAAVEDTVTAIGTFPEDSHTPITYPAAITAQSSAAEAEDFLDWLGSDTAARIWAEFGFTVLD